MTTFLSTLLVLFLFSCSDNGVENNPDPDAPVVPEGNGVVELVEPVMIQVTGGEASSQETTNEKTGFENSYDGNSSTFWHTKWSDANNYPFTATYNLAATDKLTYIKYVPRSVGTNGNFGEIEIHVATKANPNFTKVMDYDCGKTGKVSTIVLANAVENPIAVKFVIKNAVGGHASCAEMEFYSSEPQELNYTSVPLGGNSYVTAGGNGSVADAGFQNWSNSATVFSTYFKTTKEGTLDLALRYSSSADGNVIKVSCSGQSFNVTLPKGNDKIVKIGTIENVKPGYQKVDFQGVTRNGTVYAAPSDLLVAGTAVTDDMTFVNDFSFYWGRRGPSVHLKYALPQGDTEYFYNEVTVPVGEDVIGSYYMANGFGEGYFGMQVNSATERRVLFSVWSPYDTEDPNDIPLEDRIVKMKQGEGVYIGEFGNEGSGGQSYLKYPWKAGETYKFVLQVRPDGNGSTVYTAYFYATDEAKWKLIASFKRPKTNTWYKGAYSFLENFNVNQGYIKRKVHFGNQWAVSKDGVWTELLNATFTYDATANAGARVDYQGGIVDGENKFYLQNCGFFNDNTKYGAVFTRKANGKQPEVDFDALAKIPSISK